MSHTPGPWKVFRASNGKLLGIGDAEAVGITDHIGGLWRSGKEMDANANLIAAAPTLLEALEEVPLPSTFGKAQDYHERFYDWFNKVAQPAINAATGGQQ